jgi:tetratricopeptide (TPR) repeat protein
MSRKGEEAQGQEWVMIGMEADMARRQGMPMRLPIPKEEFEGLADKGLAPDKLRGWIQTFLTESEMGKDGNWRRRNSELVSQLEGFVDKKPLWDKAQKLFAENNHDEAIKTLKRITVMCPDDHAARLNYASALGNKGDYDKAIKELKQIKQSFKDDADFHVTYAQMLVMKGDQATATEELVVALELKPDHMQAMDALAKLGILAKIYENPRDAGSLVYVKAEAIIEYLEEVWSGGDRTPEYYLEQMGYHASERRWHVALAAAERAIGGASGAALDKAVCGKAAALRELGKNSDAIAALKAHLDANPKSSAAWNELAMCHLRSENKAEADKAADQALAADPGDAMALALKFWPADRDNLKDVQAAIPQLEAWAKEHEGVAGAWRSLARAMLVTGQEKDALELFQKAVALSPDDDDLRSEWWAELAKLGDHQQIIDDTQKVSNMKTRSWQLRWNEAEAYRGLGKKMEARACYMQINSDESLALDIRKRAKRAAGELGT